VRLRSRCSPAHLNSDLLTSPLKYITTLACLHYRTNTSPSRLSRRLTILTETFMYRSSSFNMSSPTGPAGSGSWKEWAVFLDMTDVETQPFALKRWLLSNVLDTLLEAIIHLQNRLHMAIGKKRVKPFAPIEEILRRIEENAAIVKALPGEIKKWTRIKEEDILPRFTYHLRRAILEASKYHPHPSFSVLASRQQLRIAHNLAKFLIGHITSFNKSFANPGQKLGYSIRHFLTSKLKI
jgi:hypothetical protein